MTLKDFSDCIEFNIQHNIMHAVLGIGAPGMGKSQLIQQIGKKYGYKVIDLRLAQMSEVEIGGLIFPNEDKTKTVWLTPDILPDEKRDGEKTILLLDEITSCPKRVQVAAYQLILDRRIGQYTLPSGTIVIALGNREDDDGVYVPMAKPLADRFEIHYLSVDFDCWKNEYALKNNVHPMVVKYLSFKPQALHTQSKSGDELIFATPRSWVRVSDILRFDSDVNHDVVKNKIVANIGRAEGMQFIDFCLRNPVVVTAEEFINGAVAPTKPEEVAILIQAISDKAEFIKKYDSIEKMDKKKREEFEKIVSCLFRFTKPEYTMMGLKRLMDKNRQLMKTVFAYMDTPEINRFIANNKLAANGK